MKTKRVVWSWTVAVRRAIEDGLLVALAPLHLRIKEIAELADLADYAEETVSDSDWQLLQRAVNRFDKLTAAELAALLELTQTSEPDEITAGYYSRFNDKFGSLKLYWDGFADDDWFIFGFEFGPVMVVLARSMQTAYDCFVDLQPPISDEELVDAYNVYDRFLIVMQNRGHDNNIALRKFCHNWLPVYSKIVYSRHDDSRYAADQLELDEGYVFQSNSTGNGIVYLGDYFWEKEVERSDYDVRFSGVLDRQLSQLEHVNRGGEL